VFCSISQTSTPYKLTRAVKVATSAVVIPIPRYSFLLIFLAMTEVGMVDAFEVNTTSQVTEYGRGIGFLFSW
jgi:hypothetical protein